MIRVLLLFLSASAWPAQPALLDIYPAQPDVVFSWEHPVVAADVKYAVINSTVPDTATTKSFSVPDGFGQPKAYIMLLASNGVDGTAIQKKMLSVGVGDGTREGCISAFDRDARPTVSESDRSHQTQSSGYIRDEGGVEVQAVFDSWSSTQIVFDFPVTDINTPTTIVIFGGTDFWARVDTVMVNSDPEDITTLVDKPDAVFALTVGLNTLNGWTGHDIFSVGVGINDVGETVRAAIETSSDNAGTSNVSGYLSTAGAVGQLFGGSLSWQAAIGDYDSSGFSFKNGQGGDYVTYLAIGGITANGGDVYLGTVDSPTASGTWASSAVGFQPIGMMMGLTKVTAVDTVDNTNASLFSLSATDGINAGNISGSSADAQTTTNTVCNTSSQFADIHHADQSGGGSTLKLDIDPISFTSNGWTSTVNGTPDSTARKGWVFAVGDGSEGTAKDALLLIDGKKKQYGAESPNYPLCLNSDGSVQAYSDITGKDPLVLDSGKIRVINPGETLNH